MTKKEFKNLFEYYKFTKKDEKQYPVVSRILKSLTPERIKKEVKAVQKVKLPPELQKWIKEYEKVGERPYFNFPWIYRVTQIIIFPATIEQYREHLWTTKTLIFMFNILIDDIADQTQNKELLEKLISISSRKAPIKIVSLKQKEKKYFGFAIKLWNYINKRIEKYPQHKEFREIFNYDNQQYYNAMRYAYLINKNPNLINEVESWLYIAHGMQVFSIMDVDLMCSKFNNSYPNLGLLREAIYYFQKMARIGNWINTWEREIKDNDFTSGVFAYALDSNIITVNDLKKKNKLKLINRIKSAKIEQLFLKEWEINHKKFLKITNRINKKNVQGELKTLLLGIEKLLYLHLISRYHK